MGKLGELDEKDRRILYQLDLDGRASYAKLGRAVRMPQDVVAYRLERLMKGGVVRGFYTVIDPTKLGYVGYRLYLRLQDAHGEAEKEILEWLTKHPKVYWMFSVYGLPDIAFIVWVKHVDELHEFLNELKMRFRPLLKDVAVMQYVRVYQYPRSYFLPKQIRRKPQVIGGEKFVAVDEIDWKILRFLAANARGKLIDVAKEAGISPAAAGYRMKRLVRERVVLGFRPLIDHRKLGLLWCKLFINFKEMKGAVKVNEFCDMHPNVSYRYETIGPWDMEIEVEVGSVDELKEFVQRLKERFGGDIHSLEHLIHFKEYKSIFVPVE